MNRVDDLITNQLALASTSWSVGVLGAIAEFHRDADEPFTNRDTCVVTDRGAISLDLAGQTRAIAYEVVTQNIDSWNHGVALCLPDGACEMNRRSVITELGPDPGALRVSDRDSVLFDLGLSSPYCDFHVRTNAPDQVAALRAACGRSLFDPSHDLVHDIPQWSPHRVFVSRLGRIEVYQPIGHGVTPHGPHTHLLPTLLRTRRTHSANLGLPNEWVPCAVLYPENPVRDDHGNAKPFESTTHDAFQALFAAHAEADLVDVKRAVANAVRSGKAPESVALANRRHRLAARIALRQMIYTDGVSPALLRWREAFEPAVRISIVATRATTAA